MKKSCCMQLAALCLGFLLVTGCGQTDPVTVSDLPQDTIVASAANLSPQGESSALDDAGETISSGSFSMPYNQSYGWDPYNCLSTENRAVMELIYEGLFSLDETFTAQPALATSYETSEDGLTWTFTLQNAAFSTGAALTAQDVVASMDRAAGGALYASRFEDIASYTADGSSTVIVTLSQANSRLPELLTFPIVPAGSAADAPAGTGPFVRTGETLQPNSFWTGDSASLHITSVTLTASISAENTRDLFEENAVDVVLASPCSASSATYHGNFEVWDSPTCVMQYLGFNEISGMFSSSIIRAAVTYAIDRETIASAVYHNYAVASVLPAPPASTVYPEELADTYAYTSAANAKSRLKKSDLFEDVQNDAAATEESTEETDDIDAGEETVTQLGSGVNAITFLVQNGNPQRTEAAACIAENLRDAGFTVTIQSLSEADYQEALEEGNFNLYLGEITLKPDFDLRALLTEDGALSYGLSTANESTIESLMENAMVNSGNFYDLYQYIMEEGLLCPVCFLNDAVYTGRNTVTGLSPAPGNLFHNIENVGISAS